MGGVGRGQRDGEGVVRVGEEEGRGLLLCAAAAAAAYRRLYLQQRQLRELPY